MDMKFSSIIGSYGEPKISTDMADTFFIDRGKNEEFAPPHSLFTSSSEINDELWFFQMKPKVVESAPVYISILKNVYVLPSGIILSEGGDVIVESLYPRLPNEIRDSGVFSHHPCDQGLREGIVSKTLESTKIIDIDRAVHCREIGEFGYFHWITTVIPRVSLVLDRFSGCAIPFLIQAHNKFGVEWINEFFPEIVVEKCSEKAHFVKELIFPSPSQVGNSHYTRNATLLQNFRHVLHQKGAFTHRHLEDYPKVIFISRSDAPIRKLVNEDDLIKELGQYNVVKLEMSSLPVREQIAYFSNADIIIGPHGAGLANLVFARQGAKVIEIMPSSRTWPGFKVISQIMGVNYFGFVSDMIEPTQTTINGYGNENFSVDVKTCARFIESCIQRPRS